MSFSTLSRKGRSTNHIKQSSFDVSDLTVANRLNVTSDMTSSSGRISPLSPFKRLSLFFRRQSSEPALTLSNQSISSTLGKDKIFGRSLSDICSPEPPKQIMDLLMFIQEVGPFTREIFRKPPNARRCRLLVDKLNTSTFQWDVDESCNGLLLAAVLKTFLREIPNKLCDDRLYNQWSAIFQDINKDNHVEKVTQIKRLVVQLPDSNQLLLRGTICVLYRIQQRSLENLMTSHNLSVCVGPCLLWTKSSNCREVERASKTVPCLVEFLIENCLEIFGRDILSVLRVSDNSLARNTSMSLDSVFTDKPTHYVDSHSIDTLTDQLGRQQMSPSRLSFDSGMILDDVSHDGETANESKASEPIHKRFNVSYDSLDCDAYVSDEEIGETPSKHINNNSLYVNTAELSSHSSNTESNGDRTHSGVDSTAVTRSTFLPEMPTTSIHRRSTGHTRPSSASVPKLGRKSSVSYDKIVYRYITEPQQVPTTMNKFYSLPRPAANSRPSNRKILDSEHRLTNPSRSHLTSSTCGQSPWKPKDIPIIVIDQCKKGDNSSKEHVTRLQILPNYPKGPNSTQQQCPSTYTNIPIYENSELYGPSLTLTRPRPRGVTQSVPLYENFPFHRHQPIIRSRSRTQTTTNNYSTYRQQTYRQQTYHNRPALMPLLENRGDSLNRSTLLPLHRRTQSHNTAALQETCYFV